MASNKVPSDPFFKQEQKQNNNNKKPHTQLALGEWGLFKPSMTTLEFCPSLTCVIPLPELSWAILGLTEQTTGVALMVCWDQQCLQRVLPPGWGTSSLTMMQLGLFMDHRLTRQSSPPVASSRPEALPSTKDDTLLAWATISSAQDRREEKRSGDFDRPCGGCSATSSEHDAQVTPTSFRTSSKAKCGPEAEVTASPP